MNDVTAEPAHTVGRRPRVERSEWLAVVGLSLLGAVVAWASNRWVFPAFSWNRDEPVYLWQAATLRSGSFSSPDGGFPEFFHPWLGVAADGRLFSQYTLGWPFVLVVGDVVFGTPAAGLSIGVAIAVSGTYAFARSIAGDHAMALVAAGALVLSPILIVQGGVYLGYLFTLGVGGWFAAALRSGVLERRLGRLVAAGALLGLIFLTRSFDAIVWALAIGVPLVVQCRHEVPRIVRSAIAVGFGAFPIVLLTLLYNQRMTGSLTTFPVTVKDPLDTYGFGTRRIAPLFPSIDYGIREAVKGTLKNGFYLFFFTVGGLVALPVAALGAWQRRRDPAWWTVGALFVAFPAGYFFFWGTNVSSLTSRMSGPIYFIPLYGAVCMLLATVIIGAFRRSARHGIAIAGVLVVAGLPFVVDRVALNRDISRAQVPWERASNAANALDHDALVFVADSGPYLMFLNPYSANEPDLDGRVLWSTERLGRDVDLIEATPDRTPYRMQASFRGDELGPSDAPKVPEIDLIPLSTTRGASLELGAVVTNPTEFAVVTATVTIDGRVVAQRVVSESSRRDDRLEFDWVVAASDLATSSGVPTSSPSGDERVTVLTEEYGSVVLSFGFGPDRRAAARPVVQHVIGYRVADGDVAMVLPARAERLADVGGPKLRWRPTVDLPEVDLDVRAT